LYASQRRTGSNLADLGRRRRAPVSLITEAGNSPECRRADGEAGVTCCGVATAMLQGPSRMPPPSSDQQVNTGTTPGLPGATRPAWSVGLGTPSADRPGVGRSRRSSRRSHDLPWGPGEPVTGRRAAVVSRSPRRMRRELDTVMPKDAPPNGDAQPTRMTRPAMRRWSAAAGIGNAGRASPSGSSTRPRQETMESPLR
jgi:hypothetical protein